MVLQAVFLGTNPAGEKVYKWLNQRSDVEVVALLTEREQLSLITELRPDLVISSGFRHKVPEKVLETPDKGVVNLHPSFLPYNRGAHPYIWPLVEDTPAGVSIHYMDSGLDEGPVIDRREVEVRPEDTARSLYDRLQEEQFRQFRENWEEIKNGAEAREQDLKRGETHLPEDLDEVCSIDLDREVRMEEAIDRLRALSFDSRKLAYFEKNGEKYYIRIQIEKD
ncbi:MAG: formyltransferase family protein [Candidatus Nanohalobium sp.]